MSKLINLNLSSDECVELAHKVYESGDKNQAIIYLKDALKENERNSQAIHFLAQIYSEYNMYVLSNALLYRGLSLHVDEDPKELYSQLSYNFMGLKFTQALVYYLKKMDLPFLEDVDQIEVEEETDVPYLKGFKLVNPKNDEVYDDTLQEAYMCVQSHQFDEALKILESMPKGIKQEPQIVHLTMICYLMKNDADRVISIGLQYLRKNDYLPIKSMLASAYAMEERFDEAYDLVNNILLKDYTKIDDILIILPVLVNLKVHAQVVKYIKRVVKEIKYQPDMYMWLAEGLYNIGQKQEAKKILYKLDKICGELVAADYYLKLMEDNPDVVEYGTNLPMNERVIRYHTIANLINLPPENFEIEVQSNEVLDLVNWMFEDGNMKLIQAFVEKSKTINSRILENLYRDVLIRPFLSFHELNILLDVIIGDSLSTRFNVVTEGKYKEVCVVLPKAYKKLPKVLKEALAFSINDIVYTQDEPTEIISALREIFDNNFFLDENGVLVYAREELQQVSKFRSGKTIAVALNAYLVEDHSMPSEYICEKYEISNSLFRKYYRILFGEEYD